MGFVLFGFVLFSYLMDLHTTILQGFSAEAVSENTGRELSLCSESLCAVLG